MNWLPEILLAYSILLMGISTPGPAVAMLLGIAGAEGRRPALLTTAGIGLGSMVLNVVTMVGLGALMTQAVWALTLFKAAGAAYLAWLAWGCFRRAANPPSVQASAVNAPRSATRALRTGFLLQATNPKALMFWLAIAAVAPIAQAGPAVTVPYVLGGGLLSFAGHAAWALALSSTPVRRAYARARAWIEGCLGVFFIAAAFSLARFQR